MGMPKCGSPGSSGSGRGAGLWSAVVVALEGMACVVALEGCAGRLTSRSGGEEPPVVLMGDAGSRDVGAGSNDDAAFSPTPDAWAPGAPDAWICDPGGDVRTAAVFYGTREDTTLMLTPGQVLAIARVDIGGLCSGLVIAPRWVLSAAHCLGARSASIAVGANPDRVDRTLRVSRILTHPRLDLMLLELSEDATVAVPGLTPIPIYPGALTGLVGRTAEAAGYGQTESGSMGARRFTAQPIVSVSGEYVSIDGMGRRGVCFGDSGGPLMLREGGQVYVLGALSHGDSSCVGVDNYTRVDQGRSWIEMHVGRMPPPPPDPCMGETREGRCDGATAIWCEGARVRRRECGRCGQRCGFVAGLGGMYCVD